MSPFRGPIHLAGACLLLGPCLSCRAEVAAPRERLPNVVLIVIDTLRADHLGCYGYGRDTSVNIDRLAARGVLFERCYSPASWTVPAVVSMFTGLLPAAHRVSHLDDVPPSMTMLAEHFRRIGYVCGGVVSNPHLLTKYGYGRGFHFYDDTSAFPKDDKTQINAVVTGGIVTDEATNIVQRGAATGKPLFLYCLYFDPHDHYVPPPPYDTRFDPDFEGTVEVEKVALERNRVPPPRELEHLVALYDGEIAYTDFEVGRLLAFVDEHLDPLNTIVIVTADHGEAFGEHRVMAHGNNTNVEEVHVPMIWRWTGRFPEGYRVRAPVSLLDIPATLDAIVGFDDFRRLQGTPLNGALRGRKLPADRIVFSQRAY